MSNLLKYFKSKFGNDEDTMKTKDYITFEKGNHIGFPSDVICCDFNHDVGSLMIGTAYNDIIIYGGKGATWSYTLNNPKNKYLEQGLQLLKTLFMTPDVIFALCKGGIIVKLQIKKDELLFVNLVNLQLEEDFKWDVVFVQKTSSIQYYLVFADGGTLKRINHRQLAVDHLLQEQDWDRFKHTPSIDLTEREILSISFIPSDPKVLLVVIGNGVVGLYTDGRIIDVVKIHPSDGSIVKEMYWDPISHYVYVIGVNNKISKWLFYNTAKGNGFTEMEPILRDQIGPYPCSPLMHFQSLFNTHEDKGMDDFLIYEGGKNRSRYDDRRTITVRQGERIDDFEVYDDIVAIYGVRPANTFGASGYGSGVGPNGMVIIVTKSEVLVIDLEDPEWKRIRPKFLYSVNNSTPTCQTRTIEIEEMTWNLIKKASDVFWASRNYSDREYPLRFMEQIALEADTSRSSYRQVHLTGHASGAITLWESGALGMNVLLIIDTYAEFLGYEDKTKNTSSSEDESESKRVNVRKIGDYDQYEDDENLAISQLHMDRRKGTIVATNRGGFVFVYDLYHDETLMAPTIPKKFTWDHPSRVNTNVLIPRTQSMKYLVGYQPSHESGDDQGAVFQMCPNLDISAIAFVERFGCLSIGSDCGFFFINIRKHQSILYVAYHLEEGVDNHTERRRTRYMSLKKSIRNTFRRKTKSDSNNTSASMDQSSSFVASPQKQGDDSSNAFPRLNTSRTTRRPEAPVEEVKHVERLIEARSDLPHSAPSWFITSMNSMRLPVAYKNLNDDVIAVGTSGGKILFYQIVERKVGNTFTFEVTKIDTMRVSNHQAVVHVERAGEDDNLSAHGTRLCVITDEQIRIHTFPGKNKTASYKLTSLEGVRVKRCSLLKLPSKEGTSEIEWAALILTNDGSVRVHMLDNPACFETFELIDKFNIAGQNSVMLTSDGEITYLRRWSEFLRFTVNASHRGWSNAHDFDA